MNERGHLVENMQTEHCHNVAWPKKHGLESTEMSVNMKIMLRS